MTESRGPAGPVGGAHARRAPGSPCWVSLMVQAPSTAKEFYGALFGWEFRPGPRQLGPNLRALIGGQEVAGIGQLPPDRPSAAAWTPYFASDDVDRTAETVRLCGGTVGVGPLDADDAGRMAIASDPTGAVFGTCQVGARPGAGAAEGPGTLAWNELVTFETANVVKFYATVFGYEQDPVVSADFDYVTLGIAGRPVAGVHGVGYRLPRARGPHWLTYFEVGETDVALRQVVELGGLVLKPAHDSGHGRVATVSDPEGTVFSVVQNPR
jgi:predicted enzyme related to lactoylglutathione lyase